MSRLEVKTPDRAQAVVEQMYRNMERRIAASPPGLCPVDMALNSLDLCRAQTCGKCVPCRIGLTQLSDMLSEILDGHSDLRMLRHLEETAQVIVDTADCAIGIDAANLILTSVRGFREDFEEHILHHRCLGTLRNPVPCVAMCPAGVDIPGYIALVKAGRFADAVRLIRKDNPFPTACAYICEHPCESRCRRNMVDDAINIRGLKRAAVDRAGEVPQPAPAPSTGKRVAVVGGGPSGLSAAYYLSLMGHKVTVYEKRRQLGGMMRYGIPAYRFPRERLDEDIRAILGVGNINVHLESPVGTDEMKALSQTCDAVFVAIGAHAAKKLRLPGIDAKGVISAVDMLRSIGDGVYPDYRGKKIAVIGGGNVAMDCVRTAVRAGAAEVNLVYRRRIEDMTALKEEIESAVAEGVGMLPLQAPVSIEVDASGACTALMMQPQMISAYSRGRPGVVNAQKPVERLEADLIVAAVGQDVVSSPFEAFGMKTHWGAFTTDEFLAAEGFSNVFVGGDCQSGPTTVIKAVGAGKVAARNIDEMLGFHHYLDCGVAAPPPRMNDRTPKGRVNLIERPVKFRKRDFNEVEIGMSSEEVQQECGRCLRCDCFGAGASCGGRIQYV